MTRFTMLTCASLLLAACGGDDGSTTAAETLPTTEADSTAGTSSTTATTTMSTTDSTSAGTMSGSESSGGSSGGSSGPTTGDTGSSDGSSDTAGSSGAESSSSGGPVCVENQGSCVDAPCCDGLDCCEGQPIPPGQAVCYQGPCPISDRNVKEGFAPIDGDALLDTLATVPITTWRYREQDLGVRHIGPMAQDFQAAFGVGASDEFIFQVDADGVALAAIQALRGRVVTLQAENAALHETLTAVQQRLDALERTR